MDNDNLRLYLCYDEEGEELAIVCAESTEQASEVYADEYDIEIATEDWYELTDSDLCGIRTQRLAGRGKTYTRDQWLALAAYEQGFLDHVEADGGILLEMDARKAG